MRTRWAVVTGVALALFVGGGTAAAATPPVDLDPGFVTDRTGVLTAAQTAEANERLGQLHDSAGVDLFVVFVDDFTDPGDAVGWADAVAEDNGLGTHQYLLAVAVEGRNYYISADSAGPVSDARLDAIERSVQTRLSDEDWAGAIDVAAEGFERQDDGAAVAIVVLLVGAVVVALVVWLVLRARRRRRDAVPAPDDGDPYAGVPDDELARQAGSALVRADDAITSSREELGFAVAQFGDATTTAFTQTVEAAQQKVAEAFALRQKLDDEIPDTAEQRRAWHIRIIQLCEQADDLLDDNVEAFEELRQLEKEAPEALARVSARRDAARAQVEAAPAALAALTASYDAAELRTVAENPEHARERLSLADAEIAQAGALLAAGTRGEAAFAIRTAEEAVVQATQLVEAISRLGADLAAVEEQARALIADLEADLAAAAQLPDEQGQLASVVASTRSHLAEAQGNLASTARSPRRMLETLDSANTEIDATMARIRDSIQRTQRNRQLLQQRLLQAQAQISAANEFITTRRGAVGAMPRTRLAEANAAYSQAFALQSTDVDQAIQLATRALQLAQEATSGAESEVSMFSSGGYGGYGGGSSGLGSDILGGIIGGIIASGGGSRSSGGSWRSGGGSSRGFRPSSFGGSRGGGSRGGGSRGRSGGGRF